MSLTLKDNSKTFLPVPQGFHVARCYCLIDLGVQLNQAFNNHSAKVLMGWELPKTLMPDGKPTIQFQSYTASLNDKANLRQILESWRGRSFTSEELESFHLKNVLGVPCYLSIAHRTHQRTQQVYSYIAGIFALPDGFVCPEPFNPTLYFDLDEYSDEAYNAVPESIRQKINLNRGDASADQPQATTTTADVAV
jgi:hypothetical protein